MSSHSLQRVVDLFWSRPEENTDKTNPIVVLGRTYTSHIQDPTDADDDVEATAVNDEADKQDVSIADMSVSDIRNYFSSFSISKPEKTSEKLPGWPAEFLDDVHSRVWLTYRTKFPPLYRDENGPSPMSLQNFIRGQNYQLHTDFFTTDCGWGCMIRTGQTMLANALIHLHLGRNWRFDPTSNDSQKHDEIVSWFADCPQKPFSIHNIVQKGRELSGKKAGEWFGPSAAARSIQALCNDFDTGLRVYIGTDSGDVYEQDVFKFAGGTGDDFKPTLILLGVRLGVDDVNHVYWECLKTILASSESIGIAGGRPSSSHYFFGYQGDYLFYLDPHIPQPALKDADLEQSVSESTEVISQMDTQSVHTNRIRKIHLSELDPSMLVGFLIKNGDEWESWKQQIQAPDHKNNIVHISPDHNPVSLKNTRKPSFVIVNEGGDDFIDVGLEYDDIPEEGSTTATTLVSDSTQNAQVDPDVKVEENESLVIISDSANAAELIEVPESRGEVMSRDTSASFENYSGSIKDDYENIATTTEKFDATNMVQVESSQFEDPFVVVKEEEGDEDPEDVPETARDDVDVVTNNE